MLHRTNMGNFVAPRKRDGRQSGGPARASRDSQRGGTAAAILAVVGALLSSGCTQLPDIAGQPLPTLRAGMPTTYRSLTNLPDAPGVTAPNVVDSAILTLSQERGSTERAAGELRGEPFIQPTPEPRQNPFQDQ